MRTRIVRELRVAIECLLIPGLAAILPWRLAYRVFRVLSRWPYLYCDTVAASLREAQKMGFATNSVLWQRHCRLLFMLDHADFFLAQFRSDAWMRAHLDVQGEWPASGKSAVLCTFHWGAGMWGLRHAAAKGMRPHALVASLDATSFVGRALEFWYYSRRNRVVGAALRTEPLDTGASLRPVLRALKANEQVLAAIDVPSDQVSASDSIAFLGGQARVPRGLLRLAVDHQIPVVVYLTGIRWADGGRFLRIYPLGIHSDLDELMRQVFAYLEDAVREDPVAWHFWAVAERFFER